MLDENNNRKKVIDEKTQAIISYQQRMNDLYQASLSQEELDHLINQLQLLGFVIAAQNDLIYDQKHYFGTCISAIKKEN